MIDRAMILDSFRTVRTNTIEVARDIPADKYDFRPVEGYNSVIEQFRQIIRMTEFMSTLALFTEELDFKKHSREEWFKRLTQTEADALKTKDQVIAALESSFEAIVARVNAAEIPFLHSTYNAPDGTVKMRLWVVQCAKEQEMSLRAQLFLFQRMLGITPHLTRRQMEREAKMKAEREAAG